MEKSRFSYTGALISALAVIFIFAFASTGYADKMTHTVKKGDTLWDICEYYYGDSSLWPKLWQLNSFITNPHLILPGETITLFEKEPVKEQIIEEPPLPVPEKEETAPARLGIDVQALTSVDMLGFLSEKKVAPWGTIFSARDEKIIFGINDIVYVIFQEDKVINIGDVFSIGNISSNLKDPVKGGKLGYVYSISGKLVIEEQLGKAKRGDEFYEKKNIFKAKITKSLEPIRIDYALMPEKVIPPCIEPVSADRYLTANIVTSKGQQIILHQSSVVFINKGSNDGIKRGNLFEVVKERMEWDPRPDKIFTVYKGVIILPDNILGLILVLDTQPETSTAIVVSSKESFSAGVPVRSLTWSGNPEFLLTLGNCPME